MEELLKEWTRLNAKWNKFVASNWQEILSAELKGEPKKIIWDPDIDDYRFKDMAPYIIP